MLTAEERLEILVAPIRAANDVRTEAREVEFGAAKLRLNLDWGVGIGGGLWSAGMWLCRQISSRPEVFRRLVKGRRVLELGSGTGLVTTALALSLIKKKKCGYLSQPEAR